MINMLFKTKKEPLITDKQAEYILDLEDEMLGLLEDLKDEAEATGNRSDMDAMDHVEDMIDKDMNLHTKNANKKTASLYIDYLKNTIINFEHALANK